MEDANLIPVAKAAADFGLSMSGIFKWLREGKLKRYRRWGDRRTFVDQAEIRKLMRPRAVGPLRKVKR